MTEIETANKTNLAHNTYRHIKVTLSAMFTFAKRKGIFDGVNPMCGVSIPKGRKHGRKRLAYSPLEVEAQLQAFDDEPTVLAIVGTAALAGLPESLVLYCARHTFGTAAYGATGNLAMVMNVHGPHRCPYRNAVPASGVGFCARSHRSEKSTSQTTSQ